jgi:hypothetical protein
MTQSKGINQPKVSWSADQIAVLRARYAHEPNHQIADDLGLRLRQVYYKANRMGLRKSAEFLASELSGRARQGMALPGSVDARFQSGHRPWNTGIKGLRLGTGAGRFTSGCTPVNRQGVGALRINTMGDLDIKMAEGKGQWLSLRRYAWELAHGPIPHGMCIGMRDHDPHNTQPENLMLLTRAENIRHNWHHRYPKPLTQTAQLLGKVRGRIRKLQEQSHAHQ